MRQIAPNTVCLHNYYFSVLVITLNIVCVATTALAQQQIHDAANKTERLQNLHSDSQGTDENKISKKPIEPMAVGNFWTYVFTSAEGETWRCFRMIPEKRLVDDETVFIYKLHDRDSKKLMEAYQQIARDDGIYTAYSFEGSFVKQIPHFPKVGDQWNSNGNGFHEIYTVISIDDSISTPAGKFKCTVVENEMIEEKETNKVRYYYSRGVGLVRTEYEDGSFEELIKYRLVE